MTTTTEVHDADTMQQTINVQEAEAVHLNKEGKHGP